MQQGCGQAVDEVWLIKAIAVARAVGNVIYTAIFIAFVVAMLLTGCPPTPWHPDASPTTGALPWPELPDDVTACWWPPRWPDGIPNPCGPSPGPTVTCLTNYRGDPACARVRTLTAEEVAGAQDPQHRPLGRRP